MLFIHFKIMFKMYDFLFRSLLKLLHYQFPTEKKNRNHKNYFCDSLLRCIVNV